MAENDRLKAYREKRDLRVSPEPSGERGQSGKTPRFVIQKHDASTLHYDVRLEIEGVLKSWSVPKGPSTDPRQRRLAIETEDHPVSYAGFEGVIPEGEYGAGTVLVWDRGRIRNLRAEKDDDQEATLAESFEEGKIEVWLEGEKLRGGYALIRTGKNAEKQWMLIKMKDAAADARRNPTSTQPESVLSGRTLDEVRNEAD